MQLAFDHPTARERSHSLKIFRYCTTSLLELNFADRWLLGHEMIFCFWSCFTDFDQGVLCLSPPISKPRRSVMRGRIQVEIQFKFKDHNVSKLVLSDSRLGKVIFLIVFSLGLKSATYFGKISVQPSLHIQLAIYNIKVSCVFTCSMTIPLYTQPREHYPYQTGKELNRMYRT